MARSSGLSWRELAAIAGFAAVPRLAGLRHMSLWLDEILGTLQSSGTLAETWRALQLDRVHPPIWGLTHWLVQRSTDSEPLRRLVPIVCGVVAVVLLADLAARWFGRRTAIFVALFAGLSPLHVRFSQELRPYSLGVLMLVLSLWWVDRAIRREKLGDWVAVGAALWAGLGSLYLVAFGLLPALGLVLSSSKPRAQFRRDLERFALTAATALLALTPWFATFGEALARDHELPASRWTLDLALRRLHFLTAGARDGEAANLATVGLALLALLGAGVAARNARGRMVLLGFLSGTVGVEILLALDDHWTNGRYSIVAWPFLMLMLAMGCDAIASSWRLTPSAARWQVRLRFSVAVLLPVVAVGGCELLGLARYYSIGRPDWLAVARDASRVAPPGRTIWVANEWTRISLGYYVARVDGSGPSVSPRVRIVTDPSEIGRGGQCEPLIVAWYPERAELEALFRSSPAQKGFSRTGARLLAIAPQAGAGMEEPWRCFPREVELGPGERAARFWNVPLPAEDLQSDLNMTAADEDQLLFGWSFAEQNRAGMTFRWALGHWAAVRLPVAGGKLRLRTWGLSETQRLTIYREHLPVAELALRAQPGAFEIDWPARSRVESLEIVHFRFGESASLPSDGRPLAAGFDRIEIVAEAPPKTLR